MTECSRDAIEFTGHARRQVVADFDGGRLTSDAGILLLREVDRRLGFIDAINECLPDPREPLLIIHQQRSMLAQRIFSIALGYEDLNDQQTMRDDPALQTAVGGEPEEDCPLASPPTLCRLENRVNRQALFRMSKVLVDTFLASHQKPPQEITLDFDATDDPLHGNQEGRFFQGYYNHYCFLPLYVFCGEHLLCAYLRPANIDAAKHSRAIMKLLVEYIRQHWPDVKITIRGGSGFCRWRTMRWCEKQGVFYIFGLARNEVLERRIKPLVEKAEAAFEATGDKQRLFGETNYAAQTWDHERRVIMKAERLPEGARDTKSVRQIELDHFTPRNGRFQSYPLEAAVAGAPTQFLKDHSSDTAASHVRRYRHSDDFGHAIRPCHQCAGTHDPAAIASHQESGIRVVPANVVKVGILGRIS